MHATDFFYKTNNYLEILLLQLCLRPFILIIISAVNWPVTFSQTLHGFTFLFHCTIQWWSLPYFTLSKSSTSLYGFLYFMLHLFLSLLSPRIHYLCKIVQYWLPNIYGVSVSFLRVKSFLIFSTSHASHLLW